MAVIELSRVQFSVGFHFFENLVDHCSTFDFDVDLELTSALVDSLDHRHEWVDVRRLSHGSWGLDKVLEKLRLSVKDGHD